MKRKTNQGCPLLCVVALLMALTLALGACAQELPTEEPTISPLSQPLSEAIALLTLELGLDEHTALDVMSALGRAGFSSAIRMAFEGEEKNTLRLWMDDATLTVVLNESGLVESISDGEHIYRFGAVLPQGADAPTEPQTPADHPADDPTGDPTDDPADDPTGDPTPPDTDEPTGEPTVPPSAQVLRLCSFPAVVERGDQVTLTAQGIPGQTYDISVRYSSGESTAKGLEPQVAGADGSLSWSFRVSSRVSPGEYPVTVSGNGEQLVLTMVVTAAQ